MIFYKKARILTHKTENLTIDANLIMDAKIPPMDLKLPRLV